ncbi:hypothetical protein EXIGLDRAFT_725832, partial [Exidia glandulosa HHB12029]
MLAQQNFKLLSTFALAAASLSAPTPGAHLKGSWAETVSALSKRTDQSWTSEAHLSPLGDWQVWDIGCIGVGPPQSPAYTNIWDAVANWFNGSDTGPTCAASQYRELGCAAAGAPGDWCTFQGDYEVWNSGIMDCYAFSVSLRSNVLRYCADYGQGDCGCGVYYNYGTGRCLVASYAYHISGPAVENTASDGPAEPVNLGVSVNFGPAKRDKIGIYYDDLAVCGHNGNGDVDHWCESAATHTC